MTVSIGCTALVPTPGTRVQQLIELADQAMYEAKRSGRDRVCVVDPDAQVWSPGAAARMVRARIDAYRHRLGLPRRASLEEAGRASGDFDGRFPGAEPPSFCGHQFLPHFQYNSSSFCRIRFRI